jgi:CMP-N,N'-diacetyllegionaminic acid synthase
MTAEVYKRYVFDIDGTICVSENSNYASAEPIVKRIEDINKLYDDGCYIVFHTARGMGSSDNDQELARLKWEEITLKQLSEWNVKFHKLFMGKPAGDLYIDDKAIRDMDFFAQ